MSQVRILSPRPFSLGKWSKDENEVRAHDEVPCITAILIPKFPEEETCYLAQPRQVGAILSPRPFSPWGNALNLRSKLARMRTKFERTAQSCLPDELGKALRLCDSYTIRDSLRDCRSQTIG